MFGLVKESKYKQVMKSNELLRSAVTNLEYALRNAKIKIQELKFENEIVEAEYEAAASDLLGYTGSLVKYHDANTALQDEMDKYKDAAEKIADIVLSLPWNKVGADTDGDCYNTMLTYWPDLDDEEIDKYYDSNALADTITI